MPSDLDARRRSGRRVATLAPRPSQPDGALAPPSPRHSHSPPPQQTELQAEEAAESSVAASSTALVAVGAAAAAPGTPDDASADDEAVRALLDRGDVADHVQLKDLAALLAKRAPACYARLCFKPGTLVASNAALAAAVGRVVGVQVRTGPVTLPGGVQARGVLRGYRIVTETSCSMQVPEDAPRAKVRRTDPALELEALRERVQALQLENARLQEVAAAAEARAAAAEARAAAAKPQAADARLRCRSPTASTASSSQSSDRNVLAHAHSLVRQVVHFERTGIEALVKAYDQVDGLHTVSANGRSWREALVGRSAVAFTRRPPGSVARQSGPPEPRSLVAKLEAGLVALGHWDAFPLAGEGEAWLAVPPGMDLDQWTRVLDAAMRPSALAILLVTGTLVPARLHTAALLLIAERLPRSAVIALNVGELDADAAAYDALASAIAQPSCVLGHLYFRDPVSETEHERKRRVRAQLRRNCAKPGYLVQLARDEVWALKGAHCWHNFSDALRSRALAWAAAPPPLAPPPAPPPAPLRWTLRASCPVRNRVARIGIGRAHQAELPVWQHDDAPPAPDRGDERVEVGEAAASAAGATDTAVAADALGSQRAAFNAQVLTAEPRRRWPDAGARRLALGPTRARELLAYVRDPANRDARGRLRLDDGKGTLLGGYGNYRATHAVEAGARHSEAEQVQHTLLLSHDVLDLARDALPGLDALVEGGLRQLPEAAADGRALVPLHGHILDQGSGTARFADHQDTEEEVAAGTRARDRRVVYTAVIALSDGGDTAMRIIGHEELAFTGEAGSGAAFRSELWHRTERASAGVWKLALFYGYLL